MSLARAFTTRRRSKGSVDLGDGSRLGRSNTLHKPSSQQPLRSKISSPVELVHTTNMLSYNAPDINPRRPSRSESTGTKTSEDGFDRPFTAELTPPTSPETDPPHLSRPQANHLSSYFMAPGAALTSCPPDAPAIPKRSPSHTKKNSIDALARKQSQSRMSRDSGHSNPGLTFSRSSSTSTRASSTSNSSAPMTSKESPPPIPQYQPTTIYHPINYGEPLVQPPPPQAQQQKQFQPQLVTVGPTQKDASPFGSELAQVTELAEEIGGKGRLDVIYEDEQYLRARGLATMSADEYLDEIHSLMASFWPQPQPDFPAQSAPLWI
jgi:hypothetical protein